MQNESGSVLWFILIGVVLLGLLTAIVSRSTSSVDQSGSPEQARIRASSLLGFSKSVETAVQNMLMRGISESDIDFVGIPAHDNTNCSNAECEVFDVEGGGIAYRSPDQALQDESFSENWIVSTQNRAYQAGCDTNNNTCTDLILFLKNIPLSICLQINKIMNITNPGGDAPQQREILNATAFTGTYSATINADLIGGTNASNESQEVAGKQAGCIYEFGSGQNIYTFYQILIAR